VTGGKPIAVLLKSISGVSAINPFPFILSRTLHETITHYSNCANNKKTPANHIKEALSEKKSDRIGSRRLANFYY
jgi:hypothetical protein